MSRALKKAELGPNGLTPLKVVPPQVQVKPLKFNTVDFMSFCTQEPEPLDFVLPGFLAGTVGALVAPGSTGKSMLALQIAIKIAGGHSPFPLHTKTGPVLYLAAEDPAVVLQHRIHKIAKHIGNISLISKNLRLAPCDGMNIQNADVEAGIIASGTGCRLIILDTLRRFHEDEENDGRAMVAVIAAMERVAKATGASVLFIHHASKSAAVNGQGGTQQASRGSSVLVDNIRWQGFLAGMTCDEADERGVPLTDRRLYVRWGASKINYSAPMQDVWLMRSGGGLLVPADFGPNPLSRCQYADYPVSGFELPTAPPPLRESEGDGFDEMIAQAHAHKEASDVCSF
ncbi:helicase RepA family protein [Mariprofundus ferrooxydans]|uniref:helicase RepA family protein n=1 Tax=Mariprofundus ferrooxydans TaxID=314344 RepID=UPI001431B7AB|nr:helicase RepA family protein [Mariprofundus ferrooxydans]